MIKELMSLTCDSPVYDGAFRVDIHNVTIDFCLDKKASKVAHIVNFHSHEERCGNGRKALELFRDIFSEIHVWQVITDPRIGLPAALPFWQKMLDEGIVDTARNVENQLIERTASKSLGM